MEAIKINQQLVFLRKERGMTQEQLANALGVTNQAVSKWESGQCCPDINLLPEIAGFFDITVDELLGYKAADSLGDIYLKIRSYFSELPPQQSFESAYRIAALLHEAITTDGYKKEIPWKRNKDYSTEDVQHWGLSICLEPEGTTIRKNNVCSFPWPRDILPLQLPSCVT